MKVGKGTFRRKLFLSYLPIVLIAMSLLTILTYWAVRRDLVVQGTRMTSKMAWETGASFDNAVEMCERSMSFLISNSEISAALHSPKADYYELYEDLSRVLLRQLNLVRLQSDEIEQITFYSENEILTGRSEYIQPLAAIEREPWYIRASKRYRLFWTVQDDKAVAVYHFIPPSTAAPDNYLVCSLALDDVVDGGRWESYDLDYFLADENGAVLRPLSNIEKEENAEEQVMQAEQGRVRIAGDTYLTAAQPLICGWTLYILVSEQKVVGLPIYTLLALVMLVIVCCVGLVWLTGVFAVRLSHRVEGLGKTMNQVRAGNLSAEVVVEGRDEIGQLEQGFRDVMQMLNSLIDDVYRSSVLQREQELALLRAQIKPHFLYNTLSLISWEAIREDVPVISDIANNMAEYYRTMLNDGQESILLRDEIRNIRSYLDIQQAAHRESFTVIYDIPKEMEDISMINMVLQPIVENAVRHGVDMREEGGGIIRVSARPSGGDLLLIVEDNGAGMDEKALKEILKKETGGYGVRNVHERILLYAGEGYGLFFESCKGKGTAVTVRLPINQQRTNE